jgi:hypothetical protein
MTEDTHLKIELTAIQRWLDDLTRDAENARKHFDKRWAITDKSWGITGSTFRAFTGLSVPPSATYRNWASHQAAKMVREEIADLAICRVDLQQSLSDAWKRSDAQLTTTYRDKLVDLFVMHMARCPDMSDHNRAELVANGNVPLDRHSLRGLGLILPAMAIGIPSMGAIGNEATYNAVQDIIRRITSQLLLPNLYFDIWTWPSDRRAQAGLPPSTLT